MNRLYNEHIKINNLNIYYADFRSIRNKMNFLEFLLSSNKYNIICLVETFSTVDGFYI